MNRHNPPSGPSRRMTLRGSLASLALPFLPSALPRAARADASAPKRFVTWFAPNGIQYENDAWTPTIVGPDWDLKLITEPLGDLREKVNLISGLQNEFVMPVDGDHAEGTGSFLTCTAIKFTGGDDIQNGISVDQVMAQNAETPFPSLQLGLEAGGNTGNCNNGYSCAYMRNLAWAGPSTPLPNLIDPMVVFQLLFPNTSSQLSPEALARRTLIRGSTLDYVAQEATILSGRVNLEDRIKLDEYLTAVREVEIRISTLGGACGTPDGLVSGADVATNVRLMSDLQVLAMQCDITRVITFMLANSGSNRNYAFIGVPEQHHDLSHHGDSEAMVAQLQTIARWEVEQYAYLLGKMDAIVESNGLTMLDNSLVYFSSEVQDGNTHTHTDLPILLAGSAGGATVTGEHIVAKKAEPLANMYRTLLEAWGTPDDTFGNSTDIMSGLLVG